MTDSADDDQVILDGLREIWPLIDPPPSDLDTRVLFAIDIAEWENADPDVAGFGLEVARRQDEALVGSGARTSERTRTITFDSDSLSVMVSILPGATGVRVDGWLAPPGPLRVELRTAPENPDEHSELRTVQADDAGRFVFTDVPHGLAQLVISGTDGHRTVVTPSILL